VRVLTIFSVFHGNSWENYFKHQDISSLDSCHYQKFLSLPYFTPRWKVQGALITMGNHTIIFEICSRFMTFYFTTIQKSGLAFLTQVNTIRRD